MANAVLYIRVSSDDQVKNNSLAMQELKTKHWCEQNSATVLKLFKDEGESARTADRPEFQKMLEFCKKHRKEIDYVVVTDLSRFARNVLDQAQTIAQLAELKIRLISTDENLDSSASGKLMQNVLGSFHQFFSDSLSEKTKGRMQAGLKAGRWMWKNPLGYLLVNKQLVLDPDRSSLIRKGFEMVASGQYSTTDTVLRQLNALGLTTLKGAPVPKQTFQRILNNEIYAGWLISGDLRVKGQHQPIVTDELFALVQSRVNHKSVHHDPVNENFPLRGLARCWKCTKLLTAGLVRGRSNTYPRYWCFTKGCKGVKALSRDELEGHFVGVLAMIQPAAELLAKLPTFVATQWATRKEQMAEEASKLTKRLQEQQDLNRRAVKAKITGEISAEDFQNFKESTDAEIAQIKVQMETLDQERSGMQVLIEQTDEEVVNFAKFWQEASLNQRIELQGALFPEGLHYSEEKHFFEPANTQLFQAYTDMLEGLVNVGVPDGI